MIYICHMLSYEYNGLSLIEMFGKLLSGNIETLIIEIFIEIF